MDEQTKTLLPEEDNQKASKETEKLYLWNYSKEGKAAIKSIRKLCDIFSRIFRREYVDSDKLDNLLFKYDKTVHKTFEQLDELRKNLGFLVLASQVKFKKIKVFSHRELHTAIMWLLNQYIQDEFKINHYLYMEPAREGDFVWLFLGSEEDCGYVWDELTEFSNMDKLDDFDTVVDIVDMIILDFRHVYETTIDPEDKDSVVEHVLYGPDPKSPHH